MRYDLLCDRLNELRIHLLPGVFEPTGLYADDVAVRVRALAYRVLAHAEFESFLEDRAVEIAKAALALWRSERQISTPLLHLLAFSGQEMSGPPPTLAAPKKEKSKNWSDLVSIDQRIVDCVSDYIKKVTRENHGIKEKNLLNMLLPIGIQHDKIDPILLEELNNFGELRGEAAHMSGAYQSKRSVDPKSEFDLVDKILKSLRYIDKEFNFLAGELKPIDEIVAFR